MLVKDFMPSGAMGRHCFTAEVAGGKQGEAVAAAAATAAVASDLRVFFLAGGSLNFSAQQGHCDTDDDYDGILMIIVITIIIMMGVIQLLKVIVIMMMTTMMTTIIIVIIRDGWAHQNG